MSEPVQPTAPHERIAILIHWMKSLSAIQGTALDGAEMAAKVASYSGDHHLAPAWIQDWDRAGRPLHGIVAPPPPKGSADGPDEPEEDTPEVKALCALMDSLGARLVELGGLSTKEDDLLDDAFWALHDWNHDHAMSFLGILSRCLQEAPEKPASQPPQAPGVGWHPENIKAELKKAGWTHITIADHLKISRSTVTHSIRTAANDAVCNLISEVLQVPVNVIWPFKLPTP